jgi:hypothetical protein
MIATKPALLVIGWALLLAGCSEQSPQDPQTSIQGDPPASAPPAVSDLRATPVQVAPRTEQAATGSGQGGDMEWDALIPDDYRPDKLMAEFQVEDMSDDDPRAAEFMSRLKELWDRAPVREDLDGVEIRLPGFVVPVEADEKETTGFLLVPYYGACVHVPPPPANQTVYVITEAGKGTRPELFDVIWVTGTMSIKRIENDVAEAGYTLYATQIEPYE